MGTNSPIPVSDALLRPRASRQLVTCFVAESLWLKPGVTSTFETILPTFSEYGIVHSQVQQTLKAYFSQLSDTASIADFAEFPDSGRIDFKDTMLGSKQPAEAFNAMLRGVLSDCGILQKRDGWSEQRGRTPILPVIPWLLFRGAKFSDKTFLKSLTPSGLATVLSEDKSLPEWMGRKIGPPNCERHLRRLRKAFSIVRNGRQSRFCEAGGCGSQIATAYPELAIMYPKSLQALGTRLLDCDELKSILKWIPRTAFKRQMAAEGVVVEFKPPLSPTMLSRLSLFVAGIRPQLLPADFLLQIESKTRLSVAEAPVKNIQPT